MRIVVIASLNYRTVANVKGSKRFTTDVAARGRKAL